MPRSRSTTGAKNEHPLVNDIIARIRDSYATLRPAEQAVADAVLADVRGTTRASSSQIAARAQVSEPTVTRFCRAIGCDGLREFKLRLAQSLVVGEIYLGVDRVPSPPPPDAGHPPYWSSVLSEAHKAISEVERQLDPAALTSAAGSLATAGHVLAFGMGGSSSALAEEAQNRLFRYGIRAHAVQDPYLARMHAATFHPGDVLLVFSSSGHTREAIDVIELARHYGAATVAITTPDGEVAAAAQVALTVKVAEYPDTLTPSASRFAFLAILDLLSAATGYLLGSQARESLRRIRYNALLRRPGSSMEPLGD